MLTDTGRPGRKHALSDQVWVQCDSDLQ